MAIVDVYQEHGDAPSLDASGLRTEFLELADMLTVDYGQPSDTAIRQATAILAAILAPPLCHGMQEPTSLGHAIRAVRSVCSGLIQFAEDRRNGLTPRDDLLPQREHMQAVARRLPADSTGNQLPVPGQGVTAGYLPAELANRLGVGTKTVNRYAKAAGVRTPQRGQREFRYPPADWLAILRHVVEHVPTPDTVELARKILAEETDI